MSALPRPKILVVDDTPANLVAMRRLLAKMDVELVEADCGNAALAATLDHEFALILLDVNMPDMDGFEVASHLADEEKTRDTPVIFVTAAMVDDLNRLKGYSFGAVDYIAKPINDTILLSKVKVFLELHRGKLQLQELVRQLESEVATRKRAEEQVRHEATHDALTGLPNRALFLDRLDGALERTRRSQRPFALLYIDIDGFKPVNDTHGHLAGDQLLQSIAGRLLARMRKSDTVARLGGDEFAVILEEAVEVPSAALRAAEDICQLLGEPYELGPDIRVTVGASIGVACHPSQGEDGAARPRDAVIRAADDAMYRAKRSGKNRSVLAEG